MGQFPAPNPVEHPKEQSKIATHNANANFTLFFAMHKQTVKKPGTEAFFFQLKASQRTENQQLKHFLARYRRFGRPKPFSRNLIIEIMKSLTKIALCVLLVLIFIVSSSTLAY